MAAFLRQFDLKLVLLGDKNSGKSALLHQFCLDDFHDLPTTFDTAFAAKRLHLSSGRPVALAIWDTAGSLKFQHITRMFIRGADVVLACFDITSKQHWERLKVLVHEARTRQPNARIYIVATKIDLLQPDQGSQQQPQQGGTTEGERSGTPSLASLDYLPQEPRSASRPQSPEQGTTGGGEDEGAVVGTGTGDGGGSGSVQGPGSRESLPSSLGRQEQQEQVQSPAESPRESSTAGGSVQLVGSFTVGDWESCTKASSRQQLRFQEPTPSCSTSSSGGGRPPVPPRQALQQAVPDDEMELYASSVGSRLLRTSAKTGEGVVELFQAIAEECCCPPARQPTLRTSSHPAPPSCQQNKSWGWRSSPGSPEKVGAASPATPTTPQQGPANPLSPARRSTDSDGGSGAGGGGQESGRQPGITQSREWGNRHWHQGWGPEEQRHSHAQQQRQQRKQGDWQKGAQQSADGQQEYVLDELEFAGGGQQRRMQGPFAPALEDKSSCIIV